MPMEPTPGMTLSQRRNELDTMAFLDIRNLACHVYKGPDGNFIATYKESVAQNMREEIKKRVLDFELANGLLQPDSGAVQPTVAQDFPTQGAAQMTQTFGPGTPFQMPTMPNSMAPATPPAPMPVAGQQVAPPPQQEAPPAPTGVRKKRGAGAAVAPPPPAPMGMPAPVATQASSPAAFVPMVTSTPSPLPFVPSAAMAPPPTPVVAQPTQNAVLNDPGTAQLIDAVGKAVGGVGTAVLGSDKKIQELQAQVAEIRQANLAFGIALMHIYSAQSALAQWVNSQGKAEALQDPKKFMEFLNSFVPR